MLSTYRYHRLDEKTRVLSTRLRERSAPKVLRIQQRTSESAEAIRSIVTTITRINEAIGSIAAAIEEQGATTAEIARSAQHAALGTQRVTANISQVNSAAEQSGKTASEVPPAARLLRDEASGLRAEVYAFIS
jgi:methyl-accepting chemotaxis protein